MFGTAWLLFACVNAALMYLFPGEETIPYHLIWASFALLYGLVAWPPGLVVPAFVGITGVTGIALLDHARRGIIGWEETSEIVLMAVIAGLLVWHIDRHRAARRAVAELREVERVRARNRELATRFGSHELRTRLTIARGFVDLIRETTSDPQVRDDAGLAVTELDKASTLSTSLMTLVRVDATVELDSVDVDELVDAMVRRWRGRVDRTWVVTPTAGYVRGHVERLEAVVDCLVENAVKFTDDGGRIAIDARLEHDDLVVVVADDGVGIPAEDLPKVTELFHRSSNVAGRAGNGLGLPIVRAAVEARGGTLHIASTVGVGTTVTIRIPHGTVPEPAGTAHPTAQVVHRPGATAPDTRAAVVPDAPAVS